MKSSVSSLVEAPVLTHFEGEERKKIRERRKWKRGIECARTSLDVAYTQPQGGNAFEASRKRVRKVDGCSRERAQYSEPTTTTVRNLKRKEMK